MINWDKHAMDILFIDDGRELLEIAVVQLEQHILSILPLILWILMR